MSNNYVLQALVFEQDFLQERKDRESSHGKMTDIKDQSAVEVNRLQTRIRELEEKAGKTTEVDRAFHQLQEDYQISQSQIIAYKKQMDIGKKELEEERKKVEQNQSIIQQKQSKIDGLNSQLRLLSTEVWLHVYVLSSKLLPLSIECSVEKSCQ